MIEVEDIITVTAGVYGVSVDDIMGNSRQRKIAEARQMAIFLTHKLTFLDRMDISMVFGRHRVTVIYAIDKVEDLLSVDKSTKRKYELINEKLYERV